MSVEWQWMPKEGSSGMWRVSLPNGDWGMFSTIDNAQDAVEFWESQDDAGTVPIMQSETECMSVTNPASNVILFPSPDTWEEDE